MDKRSDQAPLVYMRTEKETIPIRVILGPLQTSIRSRMHLNKAEQPITGEASESVWKPGIPSIETLRTDFAGVEQTGNQQLVLQPLACSLTTQGPVSKRNLVLHSPKSTLPQRLPGMPTPERQAGQVQPAIPLPRTMTRTAPPTVASAGVSLSSSCVPEQTTCLASKELQTRLDQDSAPNATSTVVNATDRVVQRGRVSASPVATVTSTTHRHSGRAQTNYTPGQWSPKLAYASESKVKYGGKFYCVQKHQLPGLRPQEAAWKPQLRCKPPRTAVTRHSAPAWWSMARFHALPPLLPLPCSTSTPRVALSCQVTSIVDDFPDDLEEFFKFNSVSTVAINPQNSADFSSSFLTQPQPTQLSSNILNDCAEKQPSQTHSPSDHRPHEVLSNGGLLCPKQDNSDLNQLELSWESLNASQDIGPFPPTPPQDTQARSGLGNGHTSHGSLPEHYDSGGQPHSNELDDILLDRSRSPLWPCPVQECEDQPNGSICLSTAGGLSPWSPSSSCENSQSSLTVDGFTALSESDLDACPYISPASPPYELGKSAALSQDLFSSPRNTELSACDDPCLSLSEPRRTSQFGFEIEP